MGFSLYALPRGAWEREFYSRFSTTIPRSHAESRSHSESRSHAPRGSEYQAQNSIETIPFHAEYVSEISNKNYAFPRGAWEREGYVNNKLRKRKVSQIYISNNLNPKDAT